MAEPGGASHPRTESPATSGRRPGPTYPTNDADVNALLDKLLPCLRASLGSQFVGLYLSGSLALGDFDPACSDVDLLIVTRSKLTEELVLELREMHARLAAGTSWMARVEAVYIPRDALRRSGVALAGTRFPQLEKGQTLAMAPLEDAWSVQCHTLREHGVAVAGPEPRTLIDPIDPDEMRRAGTTIVATWLEQARHDPSWLAWLHRRENQAFVVLTLCRILYTHDIGAVASKAAAAHWAQRAVDACWHGLIVGALAGQHKDGEIAEYEVIGALTLIEYTFARCRQPPTNNAASA